MADQLSWSAVGELLAGFVPEGPLRTSVLLVYGLCVAIAPFIYKYYLGVLAQGAAPEGRCLLLALVYPIVTIFLIWAISGDFGPAEAALGLNADIPGWERSFLAGAMGLVYFLFWFGLRRWPFTAVPIANNPGAPEYWWAYALLLSSMIPSLINLMISGMAFTRGIPWLARLILNWIPEGKAVPEYKRQPAAIGLTVQMFAGAGLGIAAQAFLAWGLIFHVMPWIGLDLLGMARAVAKFDVPLRAYQLFAGIL